MNTDIVNNLVCRFYEEIIKNGDNIMPTKVSILSYGYFQLLYNILTIFSNNIPSNDRVNIYNWHNVLKIRYQSLGLQIKNITFFNLLFYAHQGYLSAVYSNYKIDCFNMNDLHLTDIKLDNNIQLLIFNWGKEHFNNKNIKIDNGINPNLGLIIDITESFKSTNPNPTQWINLSVPSGKYTDEYSNPIIDINASSTFITQKFQDESFGKTQGFTIQSENDIPDYRDSAIITWENGMDKEIQNIINISENLNDTQKTIAEFFSTTGSESVSLSGFWIIIAMMIALRNNQSDERNIIMYFVLSCGILDVLISCWHYKNLYRTPRPISLIRHYYDTQKISSWSPINKNGSNWFPYQTLTSVSPSCPEFISEQVATSLVSGKLIEWWFNSNKLYDPYKLISIPNIHFLSYNLNKQFKIFRCGEFIFEKGSSCVESNTPKKTIILKYNTITDMYNDSFKSGLYGGIYTEHAQNLGIKLGNFIFDKVKSKLEKSFSIKPI